MSILSLSCAMLCVVEEGGLEALSPHSMLLPCSHPSSPHPPAMLSFLFIPFSSAVTSSLLTPSSCHAFIPLHPILLPCSHPSSPHPPAMLSFLFIPFSCCDLIPLNPIFLAMLSFFFTPFSSPCSSLFQLVPHHHLQVSCVWRVWSQFWSWCRAQSARTVAGWSRNTLSGRCSSTTPSLTSGSGSW